MKMTADDERQLIEKDSHDERFDSHVEWVLREILWTNEILELLEEVEKYCNQRIRRYRKLMLAVMVPSLAPEESKACMADVGKMRLVSMRLTLLHKLGDRALKHLSAMRQLQSVAFDFLRLKIEETSISGVEQTEQDHVDMLGKERTNGRHVRLAKAFVLSVARNSSGLLSSARVAAVVYADLPAFREDVAGSTSVGVHD